MTTPLLPLSVAENHERHGSFHLFGVHVADDGCALIGGSQVVARRGSGWYPTGGRRRYPSR